MGVLLGLLSAACYGTGDFYGAWAARKASLWSVLFWVQVLGLAAAAVLVAFDHPARIPWADLAKGGTGGSAGLFGVALLYAGIQRGAVGVVAPVSAVGTSIVPLTWALAQGERPGPLPLLGAAVSVVAIALIAQEPAGVSGDVTHGLLFGAGAGLGFGVGLTFFSETSHHAGFLPLLASRVASVVIVSAVVVGRREPPRPRPLPWARITGGGLGDVSATALQLVAFRHGLTSVVAPVSALYPAFTVLLARILLGERTGRVRIVGLIVAAGGLVLLGTR